MLLCSTICYSQSIKFIGIPLGIPISSFKKQLIAKGFKYDPKDENNIYYINTYTFNGKFAGEAASVSVYVTPKSKTVYSVWVRFVGFIYSRYGTGTSSEISQEYKFDKLRKSLCNKYNNVQPYDWSSDNTVKGTTWETNNGRISLTIHWFKDIEGYYNYKFLDLMYDDCRANKKYDIEANSDL